MFRYNYECVSASGRLFAGTIEASSDSEALQLFKQDDLRYLARTKLENSELIEVILFDINEECAEYSEDIDI